MTKQNKRKREVGQALVEFAFTLPILLFFAAGVFDFGRVFFVYAQASNNLRRAVREAPVIGYASASTPGYLDCNHMIDIADDVIGADSVPTVTVEYYKGEAPTPGYLGDCTDVNNGVDLGLENGDFVKITSHVDVTPVMLSFIGQPLFTFDFAGQRTIIKTLDIGATGCGLIWPPPLDGDEDYDGLCDGWEDWRFSGDLSWIATDNPDGDDCNNGCEETNGSNPLVNGY